MRQRIQVIQLTITGKKAKNKVICIYLLLSPRWRSNFCLKPANEHPEIISSSKIFHSFTTLLLKENLATSNVTLSVWFGSVIISFHGDSVSRPLAWLARPGSAPLPNTRFPMAGCVGQSSGRVGIDTRQFGYKTTECSDRGARRVRSWAYLSQVSTSDLFAQFICTRATSGLGGLE